MKITELREQTVELLPDREAPGRARFSVTKVYASNSATALNLGTWCSTAVAGASQNIRIG